MKNLTSPLKGIKAPVRKTSGKKFLSLQRLLDASLDVICSIDIDGKFIYVSSASEQVLGYRPDELEGKNYFDFVVVEDHPKTHATAESILAGKYVTNFENHYRRKNNSIVPVLWSAWWSAEDQMMYCVAKDASQKKLEEQKKRTSERRLNTAYKLAGIAWWEYNVASQMFTCSDEAFTMFGLQVAPNNQLTLEEFLSYLHRDDVPKLKQDLTAIEQDTYINYEHRIMTPSGEVIHVMHYSEVERNKEGKPISIHGTAKNITVDKYYYELEKLEREILELNALPDQDLHTVMNHYVTGIESLHAGMYCSVLEVRGQQLFNLASPNLPADYRAEIEGLKTSDKAGSCGTAVFLKEQVIAADIRTDCRWERYRELAEKHELRACWSTPILNSQGMAIATFACYYKKPKEPSELEKNTIRRTGRILQIILESYQKEKALKESIERYKYVSKATSDAIWDWDIENNVVTRGEGFHTNFGYHPEDLRGEVYSLIEFIHPEDVERVKSGLHQAIEGADTNWTDEFRLLRANQTYAHVIDIGFIIRNENGKAVRMVGAVRDITEKKQQKERLEFIAKATSEVIWERGIYDEDVQINGEKFYQLFGYKVENNTISRTFWLEKIHPEDKQRILDLKKRALQSSADTYLQEYRFCKSDGSWAYVKDRTHLVRNPEGALISLVGTMEDVTRERLAELALLESEKEYKLLFNNSPLPQIIFNSKTYQILDVNNTAVSFYGYKKEEFTALNIFDIRPKSEHKKVLKIVASIQETERNDIGLSLHEKKGGERILVDVSVSTIQYKGQKAHIATMKDVTEKEKLQKQLLQQKVNHQKQITRATLEVQEKERSEIGKELHDNVCQLLTTAKLYIENIAYFPEQKEEFTKKGVNLLLKSINEVRFLSKQLVTPVMSDVGFEATINEMVSHYQSLNLFEVYLDYKLCEKQIDRGLKLTIYRILQEQLNNTVKYANASEVQISLMAYKNILELCYRDNGQGFDLNSEKKGIGLNNIKNRAEAYKGEVQIHSSPGKGCQVEILFPLQKQTSFSKELNEIH